MSLSIVKLALGVLVFVACEYGYAVPAVAKAQYLILDIDGSGTTKAGGINSKGEVIGTVGRYGFVREPDDTVAEFGDQNCPDPLPSAINDGGYITGLCEVGSGFLRAPDGTMTTFYASGQPDQTEPYGMNVGNQIVGSYLAADHHFHGFLRQPDGSFQSIDVIMQTIPN
jgi:hypothetical protein